MASYNKFEIFVGNLAVGKFHDMNTDTVKIYLAAVAPSASLDNVKADLAEIAAGNGVTAGGEDTTNTASETAGVLKVSVVDVVVTATTGSTGIPTFRYTPFYNDTTTGLVDPLIGWYDRGSNVDLDAGDSFTIDFSTAGLFTLT